VPRDARNAVTSLKSLAWFVAAGDGCAATGPAVRAAPRAGARPARHLPAQTDMRRALTFVVGILIGQWLVLGASVSPADFYLRGIRAWERRDYTEAARLWSHAAAVQPDNPVLHYRRATALERLGHRASAADAYRLALALEPPQPIARLVAERLVGLESSPVGGGEETTVSLEPARGVWIVSGVLNGERPARFLLDTGSSVTLLSPALATSLRLPRDETGELVELLTIAGRVAGPTARLQSLRFGGVELNDLPVVIHDPGSGVDGILGNTFLGHFNLTLDADRRLLHLRRH
jgi:predicted aspartyl protease